MTPTPPLSTPPVTPTRDRTHVPLLAALGRGLTFALGLSFALMPAYGPFAGLLLLLRGRRTRWSLQRSDLLWWGAALLLALPLGLHGGPSGFLFGAAQVLAPWLIFRAFFRLHGARIRLETFWVGVGLLTGLAVVVTLGWLQTGEGALAARAANLIGPTRGSLYGHTVFALGALVAVLLRRGRYQVLSLALSALGVLISGSREAAVAWLVVAAALVVVGKTRTPRHRLAFAFAVGVILAGVSLLGPLFGWGNAGFLLDVAPPPAEASHNLLQGTEVANGDWWQAVGVYVEAHPVTVGETALTGYLLTKTDPAPTSRLQQPVTLEAGTTYTISAWLRLDAGGRPNREARPGIQGWGQPLGEDEVFVLEGTLEGGRWEARVDGAGQLLDAGVLETRGAWRRVYVSFAYVGSAPRLDAWVGLAPDARTRAGTRAMFAGFQLERNLATPYTPGAVTQGPSLQRTRVAYWQTAWRGFLESPLWGQGELFPRFFRATWPDFRQVSALPSHAHSLPLQLLYERGLIGFAGLLLFVAALTYHALRKGDAAFLVVVTALLVANLFDTTLFSGGVLYPLAAVAGWRAAAYRFARTGERDSATRQFGVRLSLMVADFAAAALAFSLAVWVRQLGALLGMPAINPLAASLEVARYALLLWPVMAWREGLYPGYGLTPPQELRKQVVSAAYAGLILAAGTVLFSVQLPIPRSILFLTILYSMVLNPVARALTKRLLQRAGLWGRPVVILGAGRAGQRIARALGQSPLDGLHPIAFFDDDPAKQGQVIAGLRVRGRLADADLYALRRGVQHAIVAIPTATPELLAGLINVRGRVFKRVQFIPDLVNLPSEGVYASDLDGLLALEVRLGLYSRTNQLFKRTVDLIGSVLGGLLIAPVLLALAVWIKLDSPGSVFYWSTRIGQRGKPFRCLKFRSMFEDADARLQEILARDDAVRAEYERFHKLERDPRVTRAGTFIRRFSLDELPQLYNVFRGEMSLVGPRPYLVQELPDMHGFQETILEAKPGMTGYWQVSGRSDVTFQERLVMEAQYVRNWSPWWDLIILVQTVTVVLQRRGAR
jgi:Undecaprenyl-phosphate galactose phosphotransferase WbaP